MVEMFDYIVRVIKKYSSEAIDYTDLKYSVISHISELILAYTFGRKEAIEDEYTSYHNGDIVIEIFE